MKRSSDNEGSRASLGQTIGRPEASVPWRPSIPGSAPLWSNSGRSMPKITIITRTKNRPRLLKRSISSVISQEYQNWQHIIVNDGGDVADVDHAVHSENEHYLGRVRVMHLPSSVGMEAATNTALRDACTEYVTILDDDDTWTPDFLSTMIVALEHENDSNVRGIVCHTEVIEEELIDGGIHQLKSWILNEALIGIDITTLASSNLYTNNAFLFYRDALDTVGYFNETLPVLGDWDFNIRFALKFDISVIRKPLARWHWRSTANHDNRNSIYCSDDRHFKWRLKLRNDVVRGAYLSDNTNLAAILALSGKGDELHQMTTRALSDRIDELNRNMSEITRILQSVTSDLKTSIRDYSVLHQLWRQLSRRIKFVRRIRSDS